MFKAISSVSLFVADQDRAKDFYSKIGFEVRTDVPLYPGADTRWLAVAPPGATTEAILYKVDEHWQHYEGVIGKPQALTFSVADLSTLVDDLKAKGVAFANDPSEESWGTYATMIDSEGNHLILVQQPDGA